MPNHALKTLIFTSIYAKYERERERQKLIRFVLAVDVRVVYTHFSSPILVVYSFISLVRWFAHSATYDEIIEP